MIRSESKRNEKPTGKLKVAVYLADQNPHRDRSLGITSMTRDLMDQMVCREDIELVQITSASSFSVSHPAIATMRIPLRTDRLGGRLIADAVHPWLRNPRADVWYYPKGYVPRVASPIRPSVGTMHDVIVQHLADKYPESRSARAFQYWIQATCRSIKRLDIVLTVSKHAANQVREFCDRHKICPPNIVVTYEGSTWENYRHLQFPKKNRVVHLASTSPHKQTDQLLRMWKSLAERHVELPQLVLVGDMSKQATQMAHQVNAECMTRLSQDQLRDLVGSSLALLLPSEIEGFGLPALESYYVGTPVCFVTETAVDEILNHQVDSGCQESHTRDSGVMGGFNLHDLDMFEHALDSVLALSRDRVREVSDRLFDLYGMKTISDRVSNALLAASEIR